MRAAILPALALAFVVTSLASLAAPTTPPPDDRALLERAESLLVGRMGDSALVLLGPAVRRAREASDAPLLAALLVKQGSILTWLSRPGTAEPGLREALRLAEAAGDSVLLCDALCWLARALSTQGETAESAALSRRMLPLARALHDRADEGQAFMLIAYHDLLEGHPTRAREGYLEAVSIFREVGSSFWELWALNGLGRTYGALGKFDAERRCYLDILARSRAIGNPYNESVALNNLGALEFDLGDPAVAVDFWRLAREIEVGSGAAGRVEVTHNLALALTSLGRFEDAAALLDSASVRSWRDGLVANHYGLVGMLGEVRNAEARHAEAAALFRRVLEGPKGVELKERIESAVGLATALAAMDSVVEARAVLEAVNRTLASRAEPGVRLDLELAIARLDIESGRAREAVARLRSIEREAGRLALDARRLMALTLLARAWRAQERRGEALEAYLSAAAMWESLRGNPRDPEWREQYGRSSREIFTGLADLMLPRNDPASWSAGETAAAREAFDRLQRFKTRTLLERMRGPRPANEQGSSKPDSIVTLGALQTEVLRAGELFIDTFAGSDVSFVFAVTRDVFRAVRLPSGDELKHRLLLYRALLSSAPAVDPARDGTETLERTGTAIGRWILGGLEDLLVSHRRVIISPDGPLNLVPANQLIAAEPGGAKEVVVVPSASVLARLRESVVSRASSGSRILALVGERRSDGTPLPGARRETGWLTRRFKGAERHRGAGFDLGTVAGEYDILHVAAHTTVYDQRPWHSGIHLGEGPADQLDIRASEIVGRRVPVQLVVLAGCESAGGRTVSGEGVLGLSSAFLSAGATCVIATLWPVDDRATSRLMQGFYEALANGDDVAGALGSAKLRMRENARWRHPFYWAGVVIIGEGGSRIPLDRKAPLPAVVIVPVALMLATVGAFAVSRRRRKRPAAGGKKSS